MFFFQYINVFNNILKNFSFLKSDFVGVNFNISMFYFFGNSLFSLFLIVLYYLVGRKIRLLFFRDKELENLNFFINIALGYISINSGIALLGVFSLFYPSILWIYIIFVLAIAFFPYHGLGGNLEDVNRVLNIFKKNIKNNRWVFFGVFLFIIIAFLRLVPPEIGEDAIGYHTSDPHLFLKNHTMMIPPRPSSIALLTPHLGEMSYLLSDFMEIKDSSRYIHFVFYFLVIFLIAFKNPYGALLFATAPVVIQISSRANVDFQWIFCWLLSIFLITQIRLLSKKNIILIGILFGGVLASKLWTIAFLPLFILYIFIVHKKIEFIHKASIAFIFLLFAILIDIVWLMRSYILSGSPVYPAFSYIASLEGGNGKLTLDSIVGFNILMFHFKNVSVFSPLFFLGAISFILNWRYGLKKLHKFNLSLFFTLLVVEYLFIRYHFGRYLLGLYSLAVLVIPISINYFIKKYALYKVIFISIFSIMFIYYFLNTLLILPYGLGWADSNKYLTRILSRDNSSYYDFDKKFNRWISKEDKVATYETFGFYYANFDYVDINYILDKDHRSFRQLRKYGVTKLFIKGGTIEWFCSRLKIIDCQDSNYKLIAQYSPDPKYLYSLREKN